MFKSPEAVREFVERVGLDQPSGHPSGGGVVVAWDLLPGRLAPVLADLTVDAGSTRFQAPGLVARQWTWRGGEAQVSVAVIVSGTGPQPARDQLLELASVNMMAAIPYVAGPAGLGDLAVCNQPSSPQTILWVYANVCARVENSGTGIPVEPVARAVQAFLEAEEVVDLAAHLPVVRAEASALAIAVGEAVEIRVAVEAPDQEPLLGPEVVERRPWLLTPGDAFAFTGSAPGTATLDVHVADARTLLSPACSVQVRIEPGR